MTSVVKSGAKYVTIHWIDQAAYRQKCAAEKVVLD